MPVSMPGQQAPTKATAVLLPAVGCPRVVPRNGPEIGYLTNLSWPPGFLYCNLYYGAGTQDDEKKKTTTISPLGPPYAAQAPSL